MAATLGVIIAIAVFGLILYARFGAHAKRRYPRDGGKKP